MLVFLTLLSTPAHAQTAPDLTGSWRLTYEVVTRNEVPVIGSLKSTSSAWVLATITEGDGGLVQTHQVCASGVTGGVVKSELPAAYVSHLPVKRYPVMLAASGDRLGYSADGGWLKVGFDPSCGPLPESAEAPCVTDWDEDGHPGATVRVKAPMFAWAEVYVAQNNHLMLDGEVVSADRVVGHVSLPTMQTVVLGASNRLFARSPTAEISPSESTFEMTRLPDGATCADAIRPTGG